MEEGGWQRGREAKEEELDRMSFSEASVPLHHWIRGVYCVPLFIQPWAVNNGAQRGGSLSVKVRTQPAEGNQFSLCAYVCVCVCPYTRAPLCVRARQLVCVFACN